MSRITRVPMSAMQKKLYAHSRLYPKDPSYNLTFCYSLQGELDTDAFKRDFESIINQYHALKTYAVDNHHEVEMEYNRDLSLELKIEEIPFNDADEAESIVRNAVESKASRVFDLNTGPLGEATLYRVRSDWNFLCFHMHHIVTDVYSFYNFLNVLSALCHENGVKSDQMMETTVPWELSREEEKEAIRNNGIEYFKKELAGVPSLGNPQFDVQRSVKGYFPGIQKSLVLEKKDKEDISHFCQVNNISPFVFYLSLYAVVMQKISREEKTVIGIPLANRRNKKERRAFGYFVNTLPLVLDGQMSFLELCRVLRSKVFALVKNQSFDLTENLRKVIDPTVKQDEFGTFNNVFTYYKQNLEPDLGDIQVSRLPLQREAIKFPLTIVVEDRDDEVVIEMELEKGLSENLDFLSLYNCVLRQVLEDKKDSFQEICLMTSTEESQMLQLVNQGQSFCSEARIEEIFKEKAIAFPDRIAVKDPFEEMTYRDLDLLSDRIAGLIEEQCGPEQDKVALYQSRKTLLIASILGILKSGRAYVPIDIFCPHERMEYMLQDLDFPLLICDGNLASRLQDLPSKVIDMEKALKGGSPSQKPFCIKKKSSLAYVIYTSGSTGKPKGVMVSHRNVVRLFEATDENFHFDHTDVWTLFHSYAFDFSVWEIFGALLYGGKLIIVPQIVCKAPDEFYKLLSEEKVTVLNQTPSYFKELIHSDEKLHRNYILDLRCIIFGGEALSFASLRPWVERHGIDQPELINMYGITETTVHVTYYKLNRKDVESSNKSIVGKPIADLDLYILGKDGTLLPPGVLGEICVAGGGVAMGYHNKEDLNRQRFRDITIAGQVKRIYASGDLGKILSDGSLEYLGRMDKQIQLRGYRIEIGEIESVVASFGGFKDCIVLVHDFGKGDNRLICYLVGKKEDFSLSSLKGYLKERLNEYMVPSYFLFIEEKPMTINGKLDYKALPQPGRESAAGKLERKTLNPVEGKIMEIWKRALQMDRIGLEENFFDLGGTSLHIPQVYNQLQEHFASDLSMVDLFQYTTVKSLASVFEKKKDAPLFPQGNREYTNRRAVQREAFQRRRG